MVMELIAEGEEIAAVPVIQKPKGTGPEDRALNLIISNRGEPSTHLEEGAGGETADLSGFVSQRP